MTDPTLTPRLLEIERRLNAPMVSAIDALAIAKELLAVARAAERLLAENERQRRVGYARGYLSDLDDAEAELRAALNESGTNPVSEAERE